MRVFLWPECGIWCFRTKVQGPRKDACLEDVGFSYCCVALGRSLTSLGPNFLL